MIEDAALLITDLVDSTLLTEKLGDVRMSEVWAAHDRVSRELLATWHGVEINRSDGFLLRFECASDAAAFATAYHRAISTLDPPVRARAGLHVGPVVSRNSAADQASPGGKSVELAGLAISMTARLMGLAQPNQTLISATARTAIGSSPLRIESFGYWRLKGVEDPIEVFEIGDDESTFVAPEDVPKAYAVIRRDNLWLPRRHVPHRLPAQRNAFVGRKLDLRELVRRIDHGARLLTVIGTGGIGKTRLVQNFCWHRLGDFPGGVWFCDLSHATTSDGLCGAVAQTLDVPLGPSGAVEQIGNAIANRGECLVVLDNFEQIASFARGTLGRWLDRASEARFIVTTRTVLGLEGEEIVSIAPLERAESADLFVHRALASRRGLVPPKPGDRDVATLVDLLEGLPLAIELAAARIRLMTPSMMVERMRERFQLLAARDASPWRQSTLQATFDWSWDLLDPDEKVVLAKLSVFEGGFDLAAAEAVLEESKVASARVLDVVQSLLDKSWLTRISDARFTMLKSAQEYAATHFLSESELIDPSLREATRERHWRYFAALPDGAVEAPAELGNLFAAVRNATDAGIARDATRVLVRFWHALKLCGPYKGIQESAARIRALPDLPPASAILVEYVAGSAAQHAGAVEEAQRRFDAGLAIASTTSAPLEEAMLLAALGEKKVAEGAYDLARSYLEHALAFAARQQESPLKCFVLNALGWLAQSTARPEEAQRHYSQALAICRAANDRRWEGGLLGNLGGIAHARGDLTIAQDHYRHALDIARESNDRRWEGNTRSNLGLLLHELGRSEEGLAELELALQSARSVGRPRLEHTVLWNIGLVFEARGDTDGAAKNYRAAHSIAIDLDDRTSADALRARIDSLSSAAAHAVAARS